MRQSLEITEVCHENFTAPYSSVAAEARAIGGDAYDGSAQPMLGQHTCNMRMMMLHGDFLRNICVKCIFCRQVFGMQIVCNSLRIYIEETLKMLNSLAKRGQRLQIF